MTKQTRKKTIGDYLLNILLFIAIAVFLYAGYKLFSIYREYKVGTDEYQQLEELAVRKNPTGSEETASAPDVPQKIQPPITVDFASLKAVNEDVVGWLYVEALGISYPIVQGKDNNQYLHTTYEGTYNFAGSIFIDFENSNDFKDPNTIVYGHNMKNGSMFGILKRIVTEDGYSASPYFWILTPTHNYRYAIFSAYTTQLNSDTYTLFKKHDKEYGEYLVSMKKKSEINTGETNPVQTDSIVTLSTCTGNSATRFVVQGVQEPES